MSTSPRVFFAGMVVTVAGLTLFAIHYLQDWLGLDPCPMCILSRYVFFAIGAVALVAALHGPRGVALKVYSGVIALLAATGIGISIRHSYLQHFPPPTETCGTDLEFLLNAFPLSQALPKIFAGSGSCSKVAWKFLGLSIPEWALVWFLLLGIAAIYIAFVRPRSRAR